MLPHWAGAVEGGAIRSWGSLFHTERVVKVIPDSGGCTLLPPSARAYARLVMNGILGGLDPVAIILVISGLLFIEECGLPMPFAPGDLVLMFGGIGIATEGVNPLVFLAVAGVASIAGALVAREILARAGAPALTKLAGRLHVRGPIDRASRLLRRSGWLGVLAGRLIPGLRIHTSQVAGVIAMPRRTFLAGLLPAVAIYIGLFTGLGVLVGPTAIIAVEHAQGLLVLAAAAILVGGCVGLLQARLRLNDVSTLARARYGYLAA
jgi:membrane protein DedA with SNARE-associated domain